MGKQKNEIVENMEFVMDELHKECDRSGATKASVFISLNDVEDMTKDAMVQIAKMQKSLENEEMTFKKSVKLSKDCYVMLRLLRKIKTEEHKSYHNGTCYVIEVKLDKEELKFFKKLLNGKVK